MWRGHGERAGWDKNNHLRPHREGLARTIMPPGRSERRRGRQCRRVQATRRWVMPPKDKGQARTIMPPRETMPRTTMPAGTCATSTCATRSTSTCAGMSNKHLRGRRSTGTCARTSNKHVRGRRSNSTCARRKTRRRRRGFKSQIFVLLATASPLFNLDSDPAEAMPPRRRGHPITHRHKFADFATFFGKICRTTKEQCTGNSRQDLRVHVVNFDQSRSR